MTIHHMRRVPGRVPGAPSAPKVQPQDQIHISARPTDAETTHPVGDYMIATADVRGRSVSLSTTMVPQTRRIASIILAQRLFGFKNEADIWRWCINHGLVALEKRSKNKEITTEMVLMNSLMAFASTELERMEWERNFKATEGTIDKLIDQGHLSRARLLCDHAWKTMNQVEEPYWRTRFRVMVKTRLDGLNKLSRERDRQHGNENGDI